MQKSLFATLALYGHSFDIYPSFSPSLSPPLVGDPKLKQQLTREQFAMMKESKEKKCE
jgi:hypothetical protein